MILGLVVNSRNFFIIATTNLYSKQMKLKFLSLVAVAALMASCSGDDDNSVKSADLVGKWYPVSYKYGGATIPYEDHEECGKDYTEFLADGVLNDVDIYNCDAYTDTGAWVLKGNKLTISFDGESGTATIKKLTGSTMQIEFKDDFDGNGTDEKIVETYTSDVTTL